MLGNAKAVHDSSGTRFTIQLCCSNQIASIDAADFRYVFRCVLFHHRLEVVKTLRAFCDKRLVDKPLVGPCSMLLTLMASGMNGQRFRFLGYLPIEREERDAAIRSIEAESRRLGETELFIETPYRNTKMLKALAESLCPETLITAATDVTGSGESIVTKTALEWKKALPELPKLPTVFAVMAQVNYP